LIMPEADSESTFWKIPNIVLERAMAEMFHYGVKIKKYRFPLSDKNKFIEAAEIAKSTKFDGILIVPSFKKEAAEVAKSFMDKEIPVVVFNSSLDNGSSFCYVGQDAVQSGRVAAKLMDCSLENDDSILVISILSFLRNNNHILDRKQGFFDFFQNRKTRNIEIIPLDIESLNPVELYDTLRNSIKSNPRLRGIFVTNSRVSHIARFLEIENKTNLKLIGYDLTSENISYLEKEIIHFLISQKPIEQAYRAMMTLFNKIVLKKEVPAEILLPIDIVTKENLKYYEEY
jgi:LacI family transcriptional regulator